jgi:hypothetical protein
MTAGSGGSMSAEVAPAATLSSQSIAMTSNVRCCLPHAAFLLFDFCCRLDRFAIAPQSFSRSPMMRYTTSRLMCMFAISLSHERCDDPFCRYSFGIILWELVSVFLDIADVCFFVDFLQVNRPLRPFHHVPSTFAAIQKAILRYFATKLHYISIALYLRFSLSFTSYDQPPTPCSFSAVIVLACPTASIRNTPNYIVHACKKSRQNGPASTQSAENFRFWLRDATFSVFCAELSSSGNNLSNSRFW